MAALQQYLIFGSLIENIRSLGFGTAGGLGGLIVWGFVLLGGGVVSVL